MEVVAAGVPAAAEVVGIFVEGYAEVVVDVVVHVETAPTVALDVSACVVEDGELGGVAGVDSAGGYGEEGLGVGDVGKGLPVEEEGVEDGLLEVEGECGHSSLEEEGDVGSSLKNLGGVVVNVEVDVVMEDVDAVGLCVGGQCCKEHSEKEDMDDFFHCRVVLVGCLVYGLILQNYYFFFACAWSY